LERTPVFENGKAVAFTHQLTFDELDVLIEAIAVEEDGVKQVQAIMLLGALMLKRTYDVTDAELERLFQYRQGDPDSETMIRSIMEVVSGSPKSKPDKVNV
jgi:hypothetical protein